MRIAGWLMLEDRASVSPGEVPGSIPGVRLSPGVVVVEDGVITGVEEDSGALGGRCDWGGPGYVVMPGLVDAHVHLPQFGIVGAHGLGLLDWLSGVTYPAELAWADAGVARAQATAAMKRMLACGTTGFAAYATVHAAGASAALQVADAMGLRAHIGQVLMDRVDPAPPVLCLPAQQLINETAGLLERWPAGGRVSAAVTPRFAPACSAELLAAGGALAAEHGALVQTHLAETRPECDLVAALFDGASYTEVYRAAGLLGEHTVLGHGIYIEEEGLATLAAHGAAIAHCPTANRFLMSGRFDRSRTLSAGVRVALGSDIGAGYEVSMVRVARAMVQTSAGLVERGAVDHADLTGAAAAWHAVTAGNADALGWPDGGRLAAGCPADLLLLRPSVALGEGALVDPLSAMLFGWDDRWLDGTLLRGRWVYAGPDQKIGPLR